LTAIIVKERFLLIRKNYYFGVTLNFGSLTKLVNESI